MMKEGFSPEEQAAWVAWVRAGQTVMARVESALRPAGLDDLSWYDALLELERAPGGRLRLSALADAMLLKRFNVTRLVDRLEKAGFVRRVTCAEDSRGIYAIITDKGRGARRAAWPLYREAVRRHFARGLGVKGLTALHALLKKMES